ncbi:MAG: ABC transporter permease [Clostridia bacterium]|nr:ABC transporter permease [Clostridia bacterium]MDO4828008.1 ABC transporter permease [Clostridia bacterium]
MRAVYLKELKLNFTGFTGYLYGAFILLFVGIYTMAINLSGGYAQFEYVLESMAFIYLIACPVLTMRAFAEEKRSKTDQLLYSLPIRLSDVVVGKYLAMLTVSLLPVAVVSVYPLLLSGYGHVDMRSAYASILMFFLLGACLTSIGMFISSVTENQVTSAVVTLVIMLITYFMTSLASYVSTASSSSLIALSALALVLAAIVYLFTKNLSVAFLTAAALVGALLIAYAIDASAFSGLFPALMKKLSLFERFYGTIGGMFDLTAIVYYLSIIGVFLFFTTETLEKRRWS